MGFFDNLSKKATETYKNTTEKTNKIAKEMKLKAAISDRKTKIQNMYTEIGKKVYEKHIREENIDIEAELADEYGQIDALSKEIEDMNTEIRALKDIRLCKTCAAEIAFEAKFCPKCGAAQENIEIKTEVKVEPAEDTTKQSTEENNAKAKTVVNEENNNDEETEIVAEDSDNQ